MAGFATADGDGMTKIGVLSMCVRIGAVAVIATSAWLPPKPHPSDARSVVYVVDRSASLGGSGLETANLVLAQAWRDRGDAKLGVVAFDGTAQLLAPVGRSTAPAIGKGDDPQASDMAAGIRLARAALPREGHRSIVLLSDARPTRGDAAAAVRGAAEEGIRVHVVPIEGPTPDLPLVTTVKPQTVHALEHQPITLDVDVLTDTSFVLYWSRDGVKQRPHYVHEPGTPHETQTVHAELVDPDPPPGVHVYDVSAVRLGVKDKDESVSVLTAVSVEGTAQVAVFSGSGDVPPVLKTALSDSGLTARAVSIEQAADSSSYAGAGLVVLADVHLGTGSAADAGFTRAAQTALVDYVKQGGGLFVTGGVFGLAPEYAGTPLARALPVEIEDRGHVEDPPVALAIMLDRSGSMGAMVGAHTKIELAIEASLGAADVLRPTDHVAIGSVDTATHWDVPLGPVERVGALRESVRSVQAGGGGIYVYTALRDAYHSLAKATTPVRHVILFSDSSDSEEQSNECEDQSPCVDRGRSAESLAHEARSKGITTTVVGIGEADAPHTPFLRRLAAAAGGRFYLTTEGTDLRRIFLAETRVVAQSNLRDRVVAVTRAESHPSIEGVDVAKLPPLKAYVESGRRAGADTPLLVPDAARPEGRPMLATWRYGLGKVGVITTDLEDGWGTAWETAPSAAKILKQTLRFLLRQHDAHRADATVTLSDRTVEVDLQLPADAPDTAAPESVEALVVAKGGTSHPIPMRLEPRGPGRWVARGRSSGEPIAIVRARDAHGALVAEAVGQEDRASELSVGGADTAFAEELARLGEGRVRPSPRDLAAPTRRPGSELRATWPYALVVAAMLVVVDLVLRRFADRRRARPRAAAWSGAAEPQPSAERACAAVSP
jgi:uncharacterized membrane protein